MEQSVIDNLKDAFLQFTDHINWLYCLVFIVSTWLFMSFMKAGNTAFWMNKMKKIPTAIWVITIGITWACIFAWVFKFNTRMEAFNMILSLMISMVVYKIGIEQFLKWVGKKLGFQFLTDLGVGEKPQNPPMPPENIPDPTEPTTKP